MHEPPVSKTVVKPEIRSETSVEMQPDEVFVGNRWEMLVDRALLCSRQPVCRGNLRHDEARESINEAMAVGTWEKLDAMPIPGDVVRVDCEFVSAEERGIEMKPGDIGIVRALDEDHDADIYFPMLDHVTNKHRWVTKRCYAKLSRCNHR